MLLGALSTEGRQLFFFKNIVSEFELRSFNLSGLVKSLISLYTATLDANRILLISQTFLWEQLVINVELQNKPHANVVVAWDGVRDQ